jgi:hypothetical protein
MRGDQAFEAAWGLTADQRDLLLKQLRWVG